MGFESSGNECEYQFVILGEAKDLVRKSLIHVHTREILRVAQDDKLLLLQQTNSRRRVKSYTLSLTEPQA